MKIIERADEEDTGETTGSLKKERSLYVKGKTKLKYSSSYSKKKKLSIHYLLFFFF